MNKVFITFFKKKGSVVKAIYFFTYKKHVNFFEILSFHEYENDAVEQASQRTSCRPFTT